VIFENGTSVHKMSRTEPHAKSLVTVGEMGNAPLKEGNPWGA